MIVASDTAARTRTRLLEATWACVDRAGFQATTAHVAAAAGCSPGTLFRHFPTRDALLRAALDEATERLTQFLPRAAPGDTLHEALRRRWEAAGTRAAGYPAAFRYWALYALTPGLPAPAGGRAATRALVFAGAQGALAAALGTPARGASAAARLVATWVVAVDEAMASFEAYDAASEQQVPTQPQPEPTAAILEQGFAAWWAGVGLSRDLPVPKL